MVSQETREFIRRAELVYAQRHKAALENTHQDSFVAIEPESGDYFLGRTLSEAAEAAYQIYPDRRTHVIRVGHHVAVHIGGFQ